MAVYQETTEQAATSGPQCVDPVALSYHVPTGFACSGKRRKTIQARALGVSVF